MISEKYLKGKKILLGITGSIAAYKSATLSRLLIKSGAEVKIIMTASATSFISSLTLTTLTGNKVGVEINNENEWHNHVDLGLWADLFIIAPCTANTLSKMAIGACDNLLTACYLSARCPVMIAPAMDLDMWKHPATSRNLNQVLADGVHLINVEYGELASGLVGDGRMAEPENILKTIINYFDSRSRMKDVRVLITSGPTHEAFDPVRFIGNHSTGKMGVAIAEECLMEGADVHFITGPAQSMPEPHPRLHMTKVVSADEMFMKVKELYQQTDVSFFVAAVADYRPAEISGTKMKKSEQEIFIQLVKNPDIAAEMGKLKKQGQINIGFALETNNESENAFGKLKGKNFDFIVLNSLRNAGAGFGHDTNQVSMLYSDGSRKDFALDLKKNLAKVIIEEVIALYDNMPKK